MNLSNGNWIDWFSAIVGFICVFIRPLRRKLLNKQPLFDKKTASADFLNGLAVVPFLLLILSIYYHDIIDDLKRQAHLMILVAGALGLFYVISEIFSEDKED